MQWLSPGSFPRVGSPEHTRRLAAVGERLRQAQVGAILLVHGTFAGYDALGMLVELGRVYPAGRDALASLAKLMVDTVAGDAGNYASGYAQQLEEGLAGGGAAIPVRTFAWSSENHHLGRADAAVRLLAELVSLDLPAGQRIMLWGHSHAGNLFALLTNLLAGDGESLARFFEACRIYFQWPFTAVVDIPVWQHAQDLLFAARPPLADHPLDIVTFGTPIRYGWDALGYSRLLHFINHRPTPGTPEHLAAFPSRLDDVLKATGGDYIQQLAIAGTNSMPSPLAWRAWMADRRLNQLLQPVHGAVDLLARLRIGARVPDAGETLLVDYGLPSGHVAQHLAGHAVYTRVDWMLFHAEEIAARLYG